MIQSSKFLFTGYLLLLSLGCDPAEADCEGDAPEGFVCPEAVGPIQQSSCENVPDGTPMPAVVDASIAGGTLSVTVSGVLFRDNNEICGYAERQADAVNVLLEPCQLVSDGGVSKGDCWYSSVSVDIDEVDVTGAAEVHVFHRLDTPTGVPSEAPREIGDSPIS